MVTKRDLTLAPLGYAIAASLVFSDAAVANITYDTPVEEPTAPALQSTSVRMPDENGENSAYVNGGLYLPTASDIAQNASGDFPLMLNDGAIFVIWRRPREIYEGLQRQAVLLGNERPNGGTQPTAANIFTFSYISGGNVALSANINQFRLLMRDAAMNTVEIFSLTVPDSFSPWMMPTAIVDGGTIRIDVTDLVTGAVLTGPASALPAGWQGIVSIPNDLGLGAFRPAQFPQDTANNFTNGVGYARGEFAGLGFVEGAPTATQLQNVAFGGDPLTVFPAAVRAWFPLTDETNFDFSFNQNLAQPVTYNSPLTQLGTLTLGSTARRQRENRYFLPADLIDPAVVPVFNDTKQGTWRVNFAISGYPAGEAIEARFLNASTGAEVIGWAQVGTTTAGGTVSLLCNLTPGIYHADFRIGTDTCEIRSPIVCGLGLLKNGQSQCRYAYGFVFEEVDSAVVTGHLVPFDAGVAERTYAVGLPAIGGGHVNKPAIYKAAARPKIIGNGFVSAANTIASSPDVPADWPIIIIDVSIGGTTIADMLANNGTPDNRDMSDIYDITRLLSGRDAQDRAIITHWAQYRHSSGAITNYSAAFFGPLLDGTTTAQVPVVDDYPYSGLAINPNFPMTMMAATRIISSTATTDTASVTDSRDEHLERADFFNNIGSYPAATLGFPVDMHRLEQDIFTHANVDELYGSAFLADQENRSVLPVLNLSGGYTGPVQMASADIVTGTEQHMDVTFTGPAGFALDVLNGGAPTGFEVDNDRTGFTASIIAADTIRLTKDTGVWAGGEAVELKPGGHGNYGAGFDEVAFMNGAIINATDSCLVWCSFAPVIEGGGAGGGGDLATLQGLLNGSGNNGVYDFTTATDTDMSFNDLTDNNNDMTSTVTFTSVGATGGEKPINMLLDATNDGASMTAIFELEVDSGTNYYLTPDVQISAFGNPPTPVWVDGVQMATRNDVLTALAGGASHVVRLTGLSSGSIGRVSAGWDGSIKKAVLIDEATVTGSDYTDAVENAELWVAS